MADEATTTEDTTTTDEAADTTATTDQTATDTSTSAQTTEADDSGDKIDWKAQARKHEARAKENAAAAKELAALKRSKMDDQQKAQADADAATERAEKAERRAALAEAAITHGLSKDDLELLDGVPADQIEARAKKLADRLKKAAPPAKSGSEGDGDRKGKKATSLQGAISAAYQ